MLTIIIFPSSSVDSAYKVATTAKKWANPSKAHFLLIIAVGISSDLHVSEDVPEGVDPERGTQSGIEHVSMSVSGVVAFGYTPLFLLRHGAIRELVWTLPCSTIT